MSELDKLSAADRAKYEYRMRRGNTKDANVILERNGLSVPKESGGASGGTTGTIPQGGLAPTTSESDQKAQRNKQQYQQDLSHFGTENAALVEGVWQAYIREANRAPTRAEIQEQIRIRDPDKKFDSPIAERDHVNWAVGHGIRNAATEKRETEERERNWKKEYEEKGAASREWFDDVWRRNAGGDHIKPPDGLYENMILGGQMSYAQAEWHIERVIRGVRSRHNSQTYLDSGITDDTVIGGPRGQDTMGLTREGDIIIVRDSQAMSEDRYHDVTTDYGNVPKGYKAYYDKGRPKQGFMHEVLYRKWGMKEFKYDSGNFWGKWSKPNERFARHNKDTFGIKESESYAGVSLVTMNYGPRLEGGQNQQKHVKEEFGDDYDRKAATTNAVLATVAAGFGIWFAPAAVRVAEAASTYYGGTAAEADSVKWEDVAVNTAADLARDYILFRFGGTKWGSGATTGQRVGAAASIAAIETGRTYYNTGDWGDAAVAGASSGASTYIGSNPSTGGMSPGTVRTLQAGITAGTTYHRTGDWGQAAVAAAGSYGASYAGSSANYGRLKEFGVRILTTEALTRFQPQEQQRRYRQTGYMYAAGAAAGSYLGARRGQWEAAAEEKQRQRAAMNQGPAQPQQSRREATIAPRSQVANVSTTRREAISA